MAPKISFVNLVSAAASVKPELDAQEGAKKGKKSMGLPPGFRGWANIKAQVKLTGGKLPTFLNTTSNHLARHERQTQVRVAHETQRAMLVAKATRKFRGRTTSDMFKEEIRAKQDLVDEKVHKLAFHERVQTQYDSSAKKPHFMQLTENQADRASDIIRKRDDWEVRRRAKADKEVRASAGMTTSDLYRMEQEAWNKTGSVKLQLPGTSSMQPPHAHKSHKHKPRKTKSSPPNPITFNPSDLAAKAQFDYAQNYNYMRPTHSSQSHVRDHYSVEYSAQWQDRQYLDYDRTVNKKNRSPRNYLAPRPFPPRKQSPRPVTKQDIKQYLPAMAAHLKIPISPYAPSLREGAKTERRMRHRNGTFSGAQTARPGARSQQLTKRPAPPSTARREVPLTGDFLQN